ncbi:MAG: hypothetical protein MZU84_04655 [Sphingobacterium sp.]|nr:hypothetical protein [Sphingobacterium sp.]
MLPRTEMMALPVRIGRQELLERLSQATQLVIPVYRAHLDDIAGLVRMRDLLGVLAGTDEAVDLTPMLHEPAHRAGHPEGRRPADGHAQAPNAPGDCHRRVRRHGRDGDLRAPDGAHRRRDRDRRRWRNVGHHGPDRWLGAHRRAGPHDGRERAVRSADRRGPLRHHRRIRAGPPGPAAEARRCRGGRRAEDPGRGARRPARRPRAAVEAGPNRIAAGGGRWR